MEKAEAPQPQEPKASDKSYLAIITMAFWAGPLGLARAYRGDAQGWVRFWIFIACYATIAIPIVQILSGLGIIVLTVWGIVDFFMLYSNKHDAHGNKFAVSETDKRWAKGMFITFIVLLALTGAGLLLGLLFTGLIAGLSVILYGQNYDEQNQDRTQEDSRVQPAESREADEKEKKKLIDAYNSLQNDMPKKEVESRLKLKPTRCTETDFGYVLETCTYEDKGRNYTFTIIYKEDKLMTKSKYAY